MESSASRRQRRASTSSMSSGQQVSGISDYSRAASDGYPYPSFTSSDAAAASYRRQPSSYSAPFSQVSRSSTRSSSSSSFRAAARGVAGVFGTCFVPRVRKDETEEASRGSRSGGFSQGSRGAGVHVSTDSAGTGKESSGLTVADISRATSNFSEKNMVKQGASSSIYKGKLKDGSEIAVKRARKLNGQFLSAELSRELEMLQKIEHQNLVRFLGFLEQREETLIVVEYVDNGSLREHLDESRGTGLELAQRLNIAIDVAHAITYLHGYAERAVIHRDIRSSNVLLTGALSAKVAGFGLARMAADDGADATHVTTRAVGTAGYVDPEYMVTLQLTDKSDVYSFGVLLVELVTGRPPIERRPGLDPRATTKWAMQKFRGGDAVVAMDPRMRRSPASVAAVEGMLRLAEQCVAPARKDRPSMRRCTEALWTVRRDYHRRQEPRQEGVAAGDRSAEWVSR
ncbi:calmodulin-binding receptor-like cytoplasmic kinase 2 isoform X1 [Lolium rigidum]|uniref:calmodulin-binding receptor-like cytoplasmic kinase 2 isoform X1 n=1 Tax=Lolium rigidum TaxID=89674 RepID=UPI001F5D77A7|nr:calmodulin-binding receptor-like cytoplasmic kinase 2 isoform X1 [Lolium rigidum]